MNIHDLPPGIVHINRNLFKGFHFNVVFHQNQPVPPVIKLHDRTKDFGLHRNLFVNLAVNQGFKFNEPVKLMWVLRRLRPV